jgi:hypothetical protein
MGAPSSSLIAEIFLRHFEYQQLAHLAHTHKITHYWRYVDDILIIYDPNHTNIQAITHNFNIIHPKLQFTADCEKDNTLNYLDITLHKTPIGIKTSIYRKPTFTDTIIPYTSNHPAQHKYAAIRHLYDRLNTYNLGKEEKEHEENTIQNILHNNSFPIKHLKPRTHTDKTQS